MSRDRFDDIPEVFRRAMEESGWNRDKNEGGNGSPIPPRSEGDFSFWRNRTFWIITLAILLFLSLSWIVNTYTEWLWFTELTYQNVWFKQWGIQVVSFVISFRSGGGHFAE